MPRLAVGDKVKVVADATSPFAGLEGTITAVRPYERDVPALDRYVVAFSWGEQNTFYDVQLQILPIAPAPPR